ncbi:MAG: hypothetical protein BGO78_10690 [Chloroflexi bacterium 44-23]|nr:MAG: hypothetical protein BGO78_10690 [Chloroflexi bacterium 44-23]
MSKKLTVLTAITHSDHPEDFGALLPINRKKGGDKVYVTIGCSGCSGSENHAGADVESTRAVKSQLGVDPLDAGLSIIDRKFFDVRLANTPREIHVTLIHRTNQQRVIALNRGDYV